MRRRYVLAPEAALDLVEIWRYIKKNASTEMADRVESVIREKIICLAGNPGLGHWRRDLTDEPVKFYPVYSYLIVYRPATKPLQVAHSPWPARRRAASQDRCDPDQIHRRRPRFRVA
jgi:plasmid stabilization system protein ParE